MYPDEARFGRISKTGKSWTPGRERPQVHSYYIREYRYCHGAVDIRIGDSFFMIAGVCNTNWMNEFLRQLSQAHPNDYILLAMDNAIWHKSKTVEKTTNIGLTLLRLIPLWWTLLNKSGLKFANEASKSGTKIRLVYFKEDISHKLDCQILILVERNVLTFIHLYAWKYRVYFSFYLLLITNLKRTLVNKYRLKFAIIVSIWIFKCLGVWFVKLQKVILGLKGSTP